MPRAASCLFLFQLIEEIDQIEEARPAAGANDRRGHGDAQMAFACVGAADEDRVAFGIEKGARSEFAHLPFIGWRIGGIVKGASYPASRARSANVEALSSLMAWLMLSARTRARFCAALSATRRTTGTLVRFSARAAAQRPCSANDIARVDDDRTGEAESADAGGDLVDLPPRMRARIARSGRRREAATCVISGGAVWAMSSNPCCDSTTMNGRCAPSKSAL